jgi:NADH-quinone oxidoreductase subunit K
MIAEGKFMNIPLEHGFILAWILFMLGLAGVLIRRNLVFVLMSLEIMLNASGLAFILAAARWGQPDGQIMFIFILVFAAAEVSVALGLILLYRNSFNTLDSDRATRLRG